MRPPLRAARSSSFRRGTACPDHLITVSPLRSLRCEPESGPYLSRRTCAASITSSIDVPASRADLQERPQCPPKWRAALQLSSTLPSRSRLAGPDARVTLAALVDSSCRGEQAVARSNPSNPAARDWQGGESVAQALGPGSKRVKLGNGLVPTGPVGLSVATRA